MVQGVINSWYLVDLMEIESTHSKAEEIVDEFKAGGEDYEENRKYSENRNLGNRGSKEVELYVLLDSVTRVMRSIQKVAGGSRKSERRRGNILVSLRKEDLRKYSEARIYSSRILDTEIPKRVFKQRSNKPTIEAKNLPNTITKDRSSFVVISSDEEKIYQDSRNSRVDRYNKHQNIKYQPTPSKLIPTHTSSPPLDLNLTSRALKDTRKRPRDDSSNFPLSKKPKKAPEIVLEIYSSIIKRAKKLDPTSALRKALSELDP